MANHSEATYVIKLAGVTDDDGIISLAAVSNAITIEVTAEDGQTTQAYAEPWAAEWVAGKRRASNRF